KLSIEEGRPADGERHALSAIDGFHKQKLVDAETSARVALARALLAQAKLTEAKMALDSAQSLSRSSENKVVRMLVALAAARLHTASGNVPAQEPEALKKILSDATEMRLFEFQL